jgi:hypothetical protein
LALPPPMMIPSCEYIIFLYLSSIIVSVFSISTSSFASFLFSVVSPGCHFIDSILSKNF